MGPAAKQGVTTRAKRRCVICEECNDESERSEWTTIGVVCEPNGEWSVAGE